MKRCKKCGEVKALSLFGAEKKNKDGHSGSCLVCVRARAKEYRDNNGEHIREYMREWHAAHPGAAAEYRSRQSPDAIRERKRRFKASEKGRAAAARYRSTDGYMDSIKRYRYSDKCKEAKKQYVMSPEVEENVKNAKSRWWRRSVRDLSDTYVAGTFSAHAGIPRKAVPKAVIETVREHIKIKRLLKEMNK